MRAKPVTGTAIRGLHHVALLASVASAALQAQEAPFVLSVAAVELPAAGGGAPVSTVVELQIPAGLHVTRDVDLGYPALRVEEVPGLRIELGEEPPPEPLALGEGYTGVYRRRLIVTAAAGTTGSQRARVEIDYMACDDSACYPPATARAELQIRRLPRPGESAPPSAGWWWLGAVALLLLLAGAAALFGRRGPA